MAPRRLLKKEQEQLVKDVQSMATWFDAHDVDIANPAIAGYLRIMLQCARAVKAYTK